MQRKTTIIISCALFLLCAIIYLRLPSSQDIITVELADGRDLVSVNAQDKTVGEILEALKSKCGFAIILNSYKLPEARLTFSFKRLSIQNAIPVIMQIAGITDYAVQPGGKHEKFALIIGALPKTAKSTLMRQPVANSNMPTARTPVEKQPRESIRAETQAAPMTTDEDAYPKVPAGAKPEPYEKRIQEFKNKYQWDDTVTMNLAEHLMGIIPDNHRDSAMTAVIKNLDEAQQQERSGSVDERMLLQAIEKTMPEAMKVPLQKAVQKYKDDQA